MRRIGLLGGECTGKTSLAGDIGRALPACVVTEQLRAFVDSHGRPPQRHEQRGLMLEQQEAEDAAARACRLGVLVADPAALMTAVYSLAYFDDDSLLDDAIALTSSYDLLVWCGTDLPWEPDGSQRDGPEARDRVHALIGSIVEGPLADLGLPVLRVSGPGSVRTEAVRRAWQLRGPRTPT